MPLDDFHIPDNTVFGGQNPDVGGLTSTFWEENCVMQDELDYGVRKRGDRRGLFLLCVATFLGGGWRRGLEKRCRYDCSFQGEEQRVT